MIVKRNFHPHVGGTVNIPAAGYILQAVHLKARDPEAEVVTIIVRDDFFFFLFWA